MSKLIEAVVKSITNENRMKRVISEMDKSQPSSSRGAEGLPVGKKAEPAKTDKVKQDALKALEKAYKKEERDASIKQTRIVEESEEITKKVRAHIKNPDAYMEHIGTTKEGHHVYNLDQTFGKSSKYAVHHPDGKITTHHVDHDGQPTSPRELSNPADFHNVHKLHPSVRSIIHQDLKDNVEDLHVGW